MSGAPEDRLLLGVGELVAGLRGLLEEQVGRVFVVGEISNLHQARSGHSYFTLKDDAGQMRAALFRGPASRVRFELEEGLEVVAEAQVSVYAARGDLQLIVHGLEPRGVGALQLAFEQLRRRLAAEGLFEASRKRALPAFPRRIGVVTSPTSAAVRDVLQVAARRFPSIPILISPTLVQGESAPNGIARALARVVRGPQVDVVLLVRGGGSLEDLQAFNSEAVARAIASCPVPVVSGVGHETDLTIADLVADVRAPTPSAAAMQAVPDREALRRLTVRDRNRLVTALARRLERERLRVSRMRAVLESRSPSQRLGVARARAARLLAAARVAIQRRLESRRRRLGEAAARLDALSPLAVLGRGFALVRRGEGGPILQTTADVAVGEALEIRLAAGRLGAEVTRVEPPEGPAKRR